MEQPAGAGAIGTVQVSLLSRAFQLTVTIGELVGYQPSAML